MITPPATLNKAEIIRGAALLAVCLAWPTIALCGSIHDATRKGDQAKVIALLKENPDLVSSIDKLGNTPLHIAALHDQPAIAALLIANGADVNAHNTPLGHQVIASSYFSQKADRDFNQKAYGETPLTLALLSYHHKEMIELLLTHGADPNAYVHIGVTPLQRAIERDLPYDVELLLANGADPDAINLGGSSSVLWAVVHSKTRILELLLNAGANPNAKDGAGHTPMFYAENGYGGMGANEEAVVLLRAHGGHL
ncbi:MAG TPA: ankyrin repeat domain-containing protein [Terracidiphilus sp.]|nr:ankyrin repeat domain-containing protein [Terracidiphilus sp.]